MSTRTRLALALRCSSFLPPLAVLFGFTILTDTARGQEPELAASAVIRVAADGSGDFTAIQPAVDAAAPGATIRVGPGTYAGPVRIAKRISLEGAGWRKTAVEAKYDVRGLEDPEAIAAFRKRAAEAETDEARMALRVAFLEKHGPKPALYLAGADGAMVRGMRFTLTGETPQEGVVQFGWVVAIRGGKATLRDCAVVGSPASGIGVAMGADAEIRDCLVAGVWSTGIEVVRMPGKATRARIVGSTIRNGHHRCVVLAGVDRETVVERCAISGSGWHGIRYDDASPVIRGNRIFGSAFGIYAAGDTTAAVTGNLFLANTSAGMICFSGCRDTIEKNTFVRNGRSALSVMGASAPEVRKNIFFDHPVAIQTGHVSEEGVPRSRYAGPLTVEANLFWKNRAIGFYGAEADRPKPDATPTPEREAARVAGAGANRVEAPGFVNAEAGDFTLTTDAPARKAGAGAGEVPTAESRWPVQPAEMVMREALSAEDEEEEDYERYWEARRKAWPWIEDVVQLKDAERRKRGLESIEKALAAADEERQLAGLVAISGVSETRLDAKRFLARILAIAEGGPRSLRMSAVNALAALGAKREARAVLEPLVNAQPSVLDDEGWHTWIRLNDGALTGKAAEYALDKLRRRNSSALRAFIASLQNAKTLASALEARVIELATGSDFEMRSSVVHFVLSGLDPKSPAVAQALIRIAEDSTMGDGSRALHALTVGIGPECRGPVADFFVRYLASRERDEMNRRLAIRALSRLAGEAQVADLEAICENPLAGDALREAVRDLLEHLESRESEPKKDG